MSVGVVGLGYVGLPLVVAFAEAGDQVVAVDVDERKVAAIEAGRSYIEDVPSERLQAVRDLIEVSTHFAPLARTDAVLICVPTPLTPNREPDLGALVAAGKALRQHHSARPARGPRIDDLSRHDPRAAGAAARAARLDGRRRAERRLLAGAGRSGSHRLHDAQHAQGRRWDHARVHRAGRRPLPARVRQRRSGFDARGRRR